MYQTPWYQLNVPAPEDTMADPVPQIDNTWTEMNSAMNPTIITGDGSGNVVLPTTGYKIGDRVYAEDPGFNSVNSSFICITNDDTPWGNWWLPVQDQSTPWRNIPAGVFDSQFEPEPGNPVQIMITNRSRLYMRGQVRMVANVQIPNDQDQILFNMPDGMRPASGGSYVGSIDPTVFNTAGGTYDQYRAAVFSIGADGTTFIRAHGATTAGAITRRAYMNQVKFWLGTTDYILP